MIMRRQAFVSLSSICVRISTASHVTVSGLFLLWQDFLQYQIASMRIYMCVPSILHTSRSMYSSVYRRLVGTVYARLRIPLPP